MISPTSYSTTVSGRESSNSQVFKDPSPLTIKDFELLNLVGRGSYGKVMLARELQGDRVYAVKVQDKAKLKQSNRLHHARNEQEILVRLGSSFLEKYKAPVSRRPFILV